jgi:hypothetical protein
MDEREIEIIVGRLYLMVMSLQSQLDAARAVKPAGSPLALVPTPEPPA